MEEGLREFLKRQFGDRIEGVPLSHLVANCYRELLRQAGNGCLKGTPAHKFRERLYQIARELVENMAKDSDPPRKSPSETA